MSIKYYHLAKDEELPDEFCAIRDVGGEPSEYTFYVPESDNAELREQMDWLASSLRNDWQIEASWDGLRRVWHIGWTDEHVENCAECAKGLGAYADSLCDPLKAENAKLRELVRDAWGDGHPDRSCEGCDIRDECHNDVERMRKDGMLRFSRCLFELRIEERMRELGIEVDE